MSALRSSATDLPEKSCGRRREDAFAFDLRALVPFLALDFVLALDFFFALDFFAVDFFACAITLLGSWSW